jgi:pimeloyl-CoA synthetase
MREVRPSKKDILQKKQTLQKNKNGEIVRALAVAMCVAQHENVQKSLKTGHLRLEMW